LKYFYLKFLIFYKKKNYLNIKIFNVKVIFMKYLKFLISLNKKSTLAIVIFFLIISTFLEYAFVGAVPLLLNTVFKSDSIPNFLLFQGMSDRQLLLRYVLILILSFFFAKKCFLFIKSIFCFKVFF